MCGSLRSLSRSITACWPTQQAWRQAVMRRIYRVLEIARFVALRFRRKLDPESVSSGQAQRTRQIRRKRARCRGARGGCRRRRRRRRYVCVLGDVISFVVRAVGKQKKEKLGVQACAVEVLKGASRSTSFCVSCCSRQVRRYCSSGPRSSCIRICMIV